uniref:C3H1-type domain-containing protein n=1 Tax=Rhodosorus marinus TaxID=101924 RepID=A0A7S3AAV2_9RHOD|mmetsp:Transcript_966/g.2444  ORF Transcript_966/g.2444 Transcript_966/m.2444 type:complete len:243 (+) Transcript_966:339-1067(+)
MQGSSQKPPSAVVENSRNATRSNLQLQLKQKKTAELRKEISKLSQTIQKKTRNSEANQKGNPYPRAPQQAAANQDKHFCFNFQRFGVCDKRKCTLNHDPQKKSVCLKYLMSSCSDKQCLLAHVADKKRIPVCEKFLEAICPLTDCRLLHVYNGEDASLCEGYSVLGYCQDGENCTRKHLLQCPNELTNGYCVEGIVCYYMHKHPRRGVARSQPQTNQARSRIRSPVEVKLKPWGEKGKNHVL